jgi:hypothetical protein
LHDDLRLPNSIDDQSREAGFLKNYCLLAKNGRLGVRTALFFLAFLILPLLGARAQTPPGAPTGASAPAGQPSASPTAGMDSGLDTMAPGMDMGRNMGPPSLIEQLEQHATAGTDAEASSTPIKMLTFVRGGWTMMLHGEAFLNEIQQTGPRGADKLFSTNWIMAMLQHRSGKNEVTFRTMLSLEPATITGRFYPELFEQGETAFGRPIVDGQHPHDFFMELAALYDYRPSDRTLISLYVAPMGDPALGPLAYPHRASASEDPLAPLGHHLQDSTHIASDVITAGLAYGKFHWEASGFHGREPDELRWNVNHGKIDSWSTRATINPSVDWSFQFSIGRLHSPEALQPADDVRRMTASVLYNRPLGKGNWASMLLWGRNQSLLDGNVGNSYLAESTLRFKRSNAVWTRIENVDRTNELVLGANPLPPGFVERYFTRVQAYSVGYDRDLAHWLHVATAIGGEFSWYGVPADLDSIYGSHPCGVVLFLRLRAE